MVYVQRNRHWLQLFLNIFNGYFFTSCLMGIFACMYVCHMTAVPIDVRRWHLILWNWTWVLQEQQVLITAELPLHSQPLTGMRCHSHAPSNTFYKSDNTATWKSYNNKKRRRLLKVSTKYLNQICGGRVAANMNSVERRVETASTI